MGVTYIGNYAWSNVNVTVDVKIEGSAGVFVALRYLCKPNFLEVGGIKLFTF